MLDTVIEIAIKQGLVDYCLDQAIVKMKFEMPDIVHFELENGFKGKVQMLDFTVPDSEEA